jgi:hypothetical protein
MRWELDKLKINQHRFWEDAFLEEILAAKNVAMELEQSVVHLILKYVTNWLTNTLPSAQSFIEAWHLVIHESSTPLEEINVHYRVYNSPVQSFMNPV